MIESSSFLEYERCVPSGTQLISLLGTSCAAPSFAHADWPSRGGECYRATLGTGFDPQLELEVPQLELIHFVCSLSFSNKLAKKEE